MADAAGGCRPDPDRASSTPTPPTLLAELPDAPARRCSAPAPRPARRSRPATSTRPAPVAWAHEGACDRWRAGGCGSGTSPGSRYAGTAHASYNEARMTPLTAARADHARTARSRCTPGATTWRYRDYWGTQVTAFDLHAPHQQLEVTADQPGRDVRPAPSPARRRLGRRCADVARRDAYAETARADAADRRRRRAGRAGRGRSPTAATPARGRARGLPTGCATRSSTCPAPPACGPSAQEAWAQRKGVCQDIAHLTVGLLRALGIPARYVSGYLHPQAGGGGRRHRRRPAPRLGRVVGRRLARLRPDQRRTGRRPARGGRPRPRLRRRDPLKGVYHGAPPAPASASP